MMLVPEQIEEAAAKPYHHQQENRGEVHRMSFQDFGG
jgi:hypothetical protein